MDETYGKASNFYVDNFGRFSVIELEEFYSVYQDSQRVYMDLEDENEMKRVHEALLKAMYRQNHPFLDKGYMKKMS